MNEPNYSPLRIIAGSIRQMREVPMAVATTATASITAQTARKTTPADLKLKAAAEDAHADGGGAEDAGEVADDGGGDRQRSGFGDEEAGDAALGSAQRFEDADFFGALEHHLAEIAGDAEGGDAETISSEQKKRGAQFEHDVRFGVDNGDYGAHVGRGELGARGRRGWIRRDRPARGFR